MRLSEIKGEKALDMLVDLIDPVTLICADQEFVKLCVSNAAPIKIVRLLMQNHKKEVLRILAILNEEDPETYNPSLIALPKMLMDLVKDPEVMDLFHSQDQMTGGESSGSAMENTEAQKEM